MSLSREQMQVKDGKQTTDRIQHFSEEDDIDTLLKQIYAVGSVPEEWNIRLKNQFINQPSVRNKSVSLWWLPAVTFTVVSAGLAVITFLLYILMCIGGAFSCMPNLLQRISDAWLMIHLAALALEMLISWIVTLVGVWKGDLVRNARLF